MKNKTPIKSKLPLNLKKIKYILKGLGTYLPPALRQLLPKHQPQFYTNNSVRHEQVNSRARYSAWLRYIVILKQYGFDVRNMQNIAEIGPGDSLATGLAGLLSGANNFYGLDIVKSVYTSSNLNNLEELVKLFQDREPIPDNNEIRKIKPDLKDYQFPSNILTNQHLEKYLNQNRINDIREVLKQFVKNKSGLGKKNNISINYIVPWDSSNAIIKNSIDLIYSAAVMEHVDDLDKAYRAMYDWLKPGGYFIHVISFNMHNTASFWNAHWTYSDFIWKLVRGNCKYFINREPFSTHVNLIKKYNLKILGTQFLKKENILKRKDLAKRFRKKITDEDMEIYTGVIVGKK